MWTEETAKRLEDWIYWIERDGNEQGAADIRAALEEIQRLQKVLRDCVLHHSCEGYEEEGTCEHSRALAGEADHA